MRETRMKLSNSPSPSTSPPSPNLSQIPSSSLIKLTSTSSTYTSAVPLTDSEVATIYSVAIDDGENDVDPIPVREEPDHIIKGQHGLIKYVILNNRRNILTLDNNGEVALWDIIKCVKVKVFGKCNISEVAQEINTLESIPNWCSVDIRIGVSKITW